MRLESSATARTGHSTRRRPPWEDDARAMSRTETAVAREAKRRALAVPLVALVAALFLPPVFTGLSLAGQRALIVTVITIVLWTGEIIEPDRKSTRLNSS